MGLFDNFSDFIPEGIQTDITAYLRERVVDPVVKIGQPQTGNLSAAEIAAGARGGTAPIAAPSAPASAIQNAGAKIAGIGIAPIAAVVAVGVLGYVLLSKRARG